MNAYLYCKKNRLSSEPNHNWPCVLGFNRSLLRTLQNILTEVLVFNIGHGCKCIFLCNKIYE